MNKYKYILIKDQEGGHYAWPPIIGSNVTIKPPRSSEFLNGTVVEFIRNDTAAVIKLDNSDYYEPVFQEDAKFNYGKGMFLLLPTYFWKPIQVSTTTSTDSHTPSEPSYPSKQTIHDKYQEFLKKGETDSMPLFQLADKNMNYFSEQEIDQKLQTLVGTQTPVNMERMTLLKKKLMLFEAVKPTDIGVVTSQASLTTILNETDAAFEGRKVMEWLQNTLGTIFPDLNMTYYKDHVYLTRVGISPTDVVTSSLVPEISYYSWQLNKPLDYQTLKYVLFQNNFQKSLAIDAGQKKEVEKLMSLEYLIGIQPMKKYIMWAVKRLIMAWYGDAELNANIRKIKIAVNLFKTSKNKYTDDNGIKPQIIVFPKYGIDSMRRVLTKVNYYFSLYPELGDATSSPTYFKKVNDLLYLTNGIIDLKMYFRKVIAESGFKNDVFNEYYTKFLDSTDVMF